MEKKQFWDKLQAMQSNLERFALSLTYNVEDSKDLVQETLLKAFAHQEKYTEDINLKAWIFTIMKNTYINHYRRRIKHNIIHYEKENHDFISYLSVQHSLESHLMCDEINREIDNLRPTLRIPFKMLLSGYKYEEIANILNVKLGTVKYRIFLSRKELMQALKIFEE